MIIEKKQTIKHAPPSFEEGRARTITFVVTEDCQLQCKYCYLHRKNQINTMSFDIAKKSIDYILKEKKIFNDKAAIFDFVGGEPLLEIDLIDKISDYIKRKMFELDHPWFNNYRFSISTNGILYGSKKVQNYINKNKTHLSIGITIDGTKKKHDLQRIYPNGKGSYDDVVKNIPLWLKQFPEASTKVTVAHDDLRYIKQSVLHLWELGIKNVNINVVFEDVWQEGDELIFEKKLISLADRIIENELYKKYTCSFFSDYIGNPMPRENHTNWCGSGRKMIAIDHKGNFYPCNRLMPFSLMNKKGRTIGNYKTGINLNKLRPFIALDRICQSTDECIDCEIASGCALCVGLNYDTADTDTIYQRATYICKMHKARVFANKYYRQRLKEKNVL
jgi:uncharacterized protein